MAQVTFVLKEPQKEELKKKQTIVFLLFRYSGTTVKYSTRQKIHPDFWNAEKQRARITKLYPLHVEFNSLLNKIEHEATNVFRRLLNDNITPTPDKIKEALDEAIKKPDSTGRKNLIAFAKKLIEKTTKKPETVANYKQTVRVLEEFSTSKKILLSFDNVNLDFYEDFLKYCHNKQYSTNTIGGFIKNIKVFMNEAFERGLHKNLDHKRSRFRKIQEESESIYLTQPEIKKIFELDLSNKTRLDKVRARFITGCFTGLRYGDLSVFNEQNIVDENKIKIKTEKTGELVVIPLHKYVKAILSEGLDKWNENISNQKMNEYLKELGELAGINQPVSISSTKGGELVAHTCKKYELITTHTARRSFATNAYLAGVPVISIMKITGHRTERSFLKYIKIGPEENADLLLNHPFFK